MNTIGSRLLADVLTAVRVGDENYPLNLGAHEDAESSRLPGRTVHMSLSSDCRHWAFWEDPGREESACNMRTVKRGVQVKKSSLQ